MLAFSEDEASITVSFQAHVDTFGTEVLIASLLPALVCIFQRPVLELAVCRLVLVLVYYFLESSVRMMTLPSSLP